MPGELGTKPPEVADDKAVLDAAKAIMARLMGAPVRFEPCLAPGTATVTVVLRPPGPDDPAGYVGSFLTCGPEPGEDHERHADLAAGNYDPAGLEHVIADLRRTFLQVAEKQARDT